MEHSKDTTDAVNPLSEKKSNENSGNTTSPSSASQAPTRVTNNNSGGGPVFGGKTKFKDLITDGGHKTEINIEASLNSVNTGVIIEPISQQELNTIEDLGFAPFTLEVRKQLIEKHVFVLYGHTRHGKRNTALHLLSMLHRTEYLEIDSYVDWKQLDNFVLEESRGYFIDMESAGNAVELTGFRLKHLNRVLEELSSYLVITVKNDKRFLELEEYILKRENLPCPYRGLKAFRMEDKEFFFGREEFTRQLVEKVRRERFVVVLGASGSGKSSVVFAGLVPRLYQEEEWIIVDCRPNDEPFQNLIQSLWPLYGHDLSGPDLLDEVKKEENKLKTGERSLRNIIEYITNEEEPTQGSNGTPRFLLIIDQFEELYTHCEEEIQKKFINMLIDTAKSSSHVPIHLVLTLRADFMSQAIESKIFKQGRSDTRLGAILGAMGNEQLKSAIIEPAKKMGIYFEDQLVETILGDVGEKAGNLPLLEFALEQLWAKCENFKLTHAAYTEIGGVKEALSRHADKTYDEVFNQQEQKRVRHIFTRHLLHIYPSKARRIAIRSNLRPKDWELITELATYRLVITDQNENDDTVEIVHETLIQNWARLRDWIKHDHVFLAWQSDLRMYMRQWEGNGKDESTLLPRKFLPSARNYLSNSEPGLERDEIEYIELSVEYQQKLEREKKQQEEERRIQRERIETQRSRLQLLFLAVLVAIIIVFVIGYFWQQAEVARDEAVVARGETDKLRLALASVNQRNTNHELALLLAIEATNKIDNLQANIALRRALLHRGQTIARLAEHENEAVKQVAWNPVNPYFFSVSDKQLTIWEAETWQQVNSIATEENIQHASWSPGGQFVAIATNGEGEETTQIWEVKGKEPKFSLGHSNDVTHLAWDNEGNRLATASRNKKVTIWNMNQLEPVPSFPLEHEGPVDYVAWNSDGSQLVTISRRQTHLWNINATTGTLALSFSNDGRVVDNIVWSNDEKYLLTVDNGIEGDVSKNNVYIWDAQTGEKSQTLLHESEVHQAVWGGDGKRVLTASDDGRSRIWDIERQEVVMTLVGHQDAAKGAIWNEDESQIMTSSRDGTVRIWDTTSGNEIAKLTGHQKSVNQAIWSLDESWVVSVSDDTTVRVWNPLKGEELPTLKGHQSEITYVAWNKDDTKIVTASEDSTAKIWDARTGETLHSLDKHNGKVNQAVWSPNGKYIVTVANEDIVRFWDAINGKLLGEVNDHNRGFVHQADWHDNGGTELFVVTAGADNTARIWSFIPPDRLMLKHTLGKDEIIGPVNQAVWNDEGKKIAAIAFDANSDEIRVWDATTGTELLSLGEHAGNVKYVEWHPDGTKLVTASDDKTARIWNVVTDEEVADRQIHELAKHEGIVKQATWSPNGARIVTASDDGKAIIWDAFDGTEKHILRGHENSVVNQANWSQDGAYIVTASNDKTAIIWDAELGEQIALLEGHDGFVNQAVWDQAGKRIITASSDGTTRIYYVLLEELRKMACQRAIRNMSEAEWQQFMGDEPYRATCPDKPKPN